MFSLTINEASELHRIDAEIHDWFYDIEDVHFDANNSELIVPFRRWDTNQAHVVPADDGATPWSRLRSMLGSTTWEAPWYRWTLRVHDALSYDLVDEARIGGTDMNSIGYDPGQQVVTIEGNIEVTITVAVQRLSVSVEETEEVIGLARYTTYAGGGDSYSGEVLDFT